MAGSSVAANIEGFAYTATNAFAQTSLCFTSQNLGAGKHERVPAIMRTVGAVGMIISTVLSAAMLLFPQPIFDLFTTDAQVLGAASILVVPAILNFYGAATRSISFALINGSGNTKLNFAVAIIDGMISRIGIAALLGFGIGMGCEGFWYGDALAGFMPFVIGMCYYIFGKWKK